MWESHRSINDSLKYIVEYANPQYRNQTPEPLGITLRDNPEKAIGTVGCAWASKTSQSMELMYALAEPYWGQGLAGEASKAIMDYCFKTLPVIRIQARCKTENRASARVMEKIGMTFEGTLKAALFHRNQHWDIRYFAVLKDEWKCMMY
jgi:ribosomal-protein-alanine N-acetyltransferase